MTARQLFTIGHSNHAIETFRALLQQHAIVTIADVRSVPYSRRNPAYNREALTRSLAAAGITYVFLGDELGAKSKDPAHYENNRVQYDRLAARPEFKRALGQLIEHAQTQRLAIMCAEKEPLECHRTLLVARALEAAGVRVVHVLADGRLEPHDVALQRMRALVGVPELDLLRTQPELDAEAYSRQSQRIAYVQQPVLAPAKPTP